MIAGAGFAMMTWRLACIRTDQFTSNLCNRPFGIDRGHCRTCDEYFRIIDNATQGFTGLRVARLLEMLGDDPRVTL